MLQKVPFGLTLSGLKARILLVNDVNAAFATHDDTVFVPLLGGF
jgi:hypothetical protein